MSIFEEYGAFKGTEHKSYYAIFCKKRQLIRLFVCLPAHQVISKNDLLQKERKCSPREQILSSRVSPRDHFIYF